MQRCAMAAIKLGGLTLVLRFGGGFCATLMAMVFPPLLFVRVRATRGWNTRVVCGSRGGLAIILAIGTSCWMLSNYSLTTDVLTQMGILSPPADDTTNTTAEILEAFGSVVSIL
ncbi:unnamed protein product [Durusdinium trenchii]|uniref:Amino acid transporter transmembrane domain-containing protein n=1 Tax=Durusdinium trenchii TaxID=1381693 RepID=A0ABP0KN38_9DINO